jgi:hypothetical protein
VTVRSAQRIKFRRFSFAIPKAAFQKKTASGFLNTNTHHGFFQTNTLSGFSFKNTKRKTPIRFYSERGKRLFNFYFTT